MPAAASEIALDIFMARRSISAGCCRGYYVDAMLSVFMIIHAVLAVGPIDGAERERTREKFIGL
jgi:hypothetical protein